MRQRIFILLCVLAPLLAQAGLLDIYGMLSGKTLLSPSSLPLPPDSILSNLTDDRTNAMAKIEAEFSKAGIAVIQDGPHFIRLVPEKQKDVLTNAPLRGALLPVAGDQHAGVVGSIDFIGADLQQILTLYASMSHRTILRGANLPVPRVTLRSQTNLTQEEVLYAIATVLALNGIGMVDDGDKFVQVVPIAERSRVSPRAPKPEPGAALLDPAKVPSTGPLATSKPLNPMEREILRLQKAFYEFTHYQRPPERPADRLLKLYASLAEKTAQSSKEFDGMPIFFHVETPLTRGELLYAIETTLHLHGLVLIPVDDQKIRLGAVAELNRGPSKRSEKLQPKP